MTLPRVVALLLASAVFGAGGFAASSCVGHLYSDHLLVDALRANIQQQQAQQAKPAQ
jgi:hypothetical protein